MNQHQGKYGKTGFHLIFLFFIIICSSFISVASAGAPPLDNRPGYLLPHLFSPYINQSAGDCFNETDSFKAFNQPFRPPLFFLNMSEYYTFMNISCEKTGERYVSEVWYFTDWDEFRLQREHLFSYLTQHGTVSNVTLDLSEELVRTNNTYLAGLKTRQVRAIKYENTTTSGYFLIFYTDFFPGPSYYIAYYGVAGSSGIQEHTHQLETLIMTTFPGLMECQTYEINPESPMTRSTPLPTGLFFIAVMVVMFIRSLRGRL